MSERNLPDFELLSALLDDELDDTQRARATELLESSPEAQHQYGEWAHVSEILKSLPSESPHEPLRPAVMAAIEREMLLGPAPKQSGPTGHHGGSPERRSAEHRSRSHSLWGWGTGLLAACALMFVMVQLLQQTEPERESVTQAPTDAAAETAVADRGAELEDDPVAGLVEIEKQAISEAAATASDSRPDSRKTEQRIGPSADEAVERPNQPRTQSGIQPDTQPDTPRRNPADAAGVSRPEMPFSVQDRPIAADSAFRGGEAESLQLPADAEETPVGGLIQALELSGDRITVVELIVVDKRQGLDQLQLLLSRKQLDGGYGQTGGYGGQGETAERTDETGDSRSDELLAVLVAAPNQSLAGTIRDLKRTTGFRSVNVRDDVPVQDVVASLVDEEAAGARVSEADVDDAVAAPATPTPSRAAAEPSLAGNDRRDRTLSMSRPARQGSDATQAQTQVTLGKPFRLDREFLRKVADSEETELRKPPADAEESERLPAATVLFVVVSPADVSTNSNSPDPPAAAEPAAPRGESA